MPKMHYFSNRFLKIFNIDDLKLSDLTKLWFFKLIVTKSKFKNQL